MKYKVLVVDDEPIILSGIRHLIDWNDVDAEIAGCAANGKEAYSLIEALHPDIVITDIKMPVMDGLALAGKCSEEFPWVVFVILTSLAEFSLAKEAIGYGITDYLLKTELDAATLKATMERAEEECRRRHGSYSSQHTSSDTDGTARSISSLLIMRDITNSTRMLLEEKGLVRDFAFIAFAFSFPSPSLEKQWSPEDYRKLHEWEKDIIDKILSSTLKSFWPVMPVAGKAGSLVYFVSGISPATWQAMSSRLEDKARSASSMVTGLRPTLLRTPVMNGSENLRAARDSIETAMQSYYLEKDIKSISPEPLDVDAVFPKLENAIAAKDMVSCKSCFSVIRNAISGKDHSLSQFSFLATAIHSAVSSALSSIGLQEEISVLEAYETAEFISRRSEALTFIDDIENSLMMLIESKGGTGSDVADKAREYVMAHITDRIALSDVAAYACVSPGYMSKSFKRIMGISLVDYINSMKIEKAKDMMEKNPSLRIADIALALGFHNIYYFSKVFRKVEGIPPTEYLKKKE